MGFHGDDLAAFVAGGAGTKDVLGLRETIRKIRVPGVDVVDVYLVFGDVDFIAAVRASVGGSPPATQRIAEWVSRVRELPDVKGTKTYIVVADPKAHRGTTKKKNR